MKHHTETIPLNLAEKLKAAGMSMDIWKGVSQGLPFISVMEESAFDWLDKEFGNEPSKIEKRYSVPTYAEVFDWFADSKLNIEVSPYINELGILVYIPIVKAIGCGDIATYFVDFCPAWHKAANAAIEKALTLI